MAVSMGGLANLTSQNLRKLVLDETHLPGRFDFELRWDLSDPAYRLPAARWITYSSIP